MSETTITFVARQAPVLEDRTHSPSDGLTVLKLSATRSRVIMVCYCFLSFVICNIDRISLSVAIIPMSKKFGWTSSTQGLIQSAFFLGYMITPVPGGLLSDAHGGRRVLAVGVLLWSVCTCLTPSAASASLSWLLVIRVALGVGEGLAMPAMNAIVAARVPLEERGRSLAFIYSGMYGGSILGLATAPALIAWGGWAAVFYVFGGAGLLWVLLFCMTTDDIQVDSDHNMNVNGAVARPGGKHVSLSGSACLDQAEQPYRAGCIDVETQGPESAEGVADEKEESTCFENADDAPAEPLAPSMDVGSSSPKLFSAPAISTLLKHRCVWVIIVAHFCSTWGYFVLLAWLPTYLLMEFGVDLKASALLSAIPWISMFVSANIGGAIADAMIRNGVIVTHVRKTMQSVGFLGPAAFLGALCTAQNVYSAMAYVSCGLALSSFSQSGVYANHQDVGPRIAGTLLGISNTFASLPGLVGVFITGVILEQTENNWSIVFAIAISVYMFGLAVYIAYATSERQW